MMTLTERRRSKVGQKSPVTLRQNTQQAQSRRTSERRVWKTVYQKAKVAYMYLLQTCIFHIRMQNGVPVIQHIHHECAFSLIDSV